MVTRTIGIQVSAVPETACTDKHCPYHGQLPVRGRVFEGVVTSTKRQKTITVRRDYLFKITKYNRYERRNSKQSVHCPPCIHVEEGDTVVYMETRKVSKTVSSVVIENMSRGTKASDEQQV